MSKSKGAFCSWWFYWTTTKQGRNKLQVTQNVKDCILIKVIVHQIKQHGTLYYEDKFLKNCHEAERDVNNEEPGHSSFSCPYHNM
jgi:hypothetical protein